MKVTKKQLLTMISTFCLIGSSIHGSRGEIRYEEPTSIERERERERVIPL